MKKTLIFSIFFFFVFILPANADEWYNESYAYRTKLEVDHTKASGSLSNFPIYVDLSILGSDHGFWQNTSGNDLLITASSGARLPLEIVSISTSSKTGEIHYKGTLSSTTNAVFWLYYGSTTAAQPDVSATYGRNSVWSDFVGVWHMQETPTNNAIFYSSTGQNNATLTDENSNSSQINGKLGKSIDFYGDADYLKPATESNFDISSNALTIGVWIKSPDNDWASWIAKNGEGSGYYMGNDNTNANLKVNGGYIATSDNVLNGNWHMITGTFGNGTMKIYTDGVFRTSAASSIVNNNDPFTIGCKYVGGYQNYTAAALDEARVMHAERSVGWIKTIYNNQNSPSTFFIIHDQESFEQEQPPAENYFSTTSDIFTISTYEENGKTYYNAAALEFLFILSIVFAAALILK